MELLVNDVSLAGQFTSHQAFSSAIEVLMKMRGIARAFGRELRCSRRLSGAKVTATMNVQQAVQMMALAQRQAFMQWIARHGPFWEDDRTHSADDYLEYDGAVVTDTALGEAAFGLLKGRDQHVASLVPSTFELTPIPVVWHSGTEEASEIQVPNYWDPVSLEAALTLVPPAVLSWEQTLSTAKLRFQNLSFPEDCFDALRPHPFVSGAARQILVLLDVLNRIKECHGPDGERSEEGHRLYQQHFTGEKAWFSDSSEAEKNEFSRELTFRNPATGRKDLFCPWHGKVKTPQIRIHFSTPIRAGEPLHVVYCGPKLTKR